MRNLLVPRPARTCLVATIIGAAFCAAAGTASAACDAVCQAAFVTEHNAVRTRVNSGTETGPGGTFQPKASPALGALTWDAGVATDAQNYANGCAFQHSGQPNRGENLYASTGAQTLTTPADAVTGPQSWESESTAFTYGAIPAPNQSSVGHYTQLVWANTTAVGCGITSCTTNSPFPPQFGPAWVLVVCQYTPPGNVIGQFPYQNTPIVPGIPAGPLDVDGNGQYDALTDGIILLRYLFGLTGASLVSNALAPNASITSPATILTNLTTLRPQLDIDGNGQVDALTDGLLVLRYLFGLRGAALISGAVGANATRTSALQIEPVIAALKP